jgi:hypothetical protein
MAFTELFNFRRSPFGEKTKTVLEKRGATRGRLKEKNTFCRLCLLVSIAHSLAEW